MQHGGGGLLDVPGRALRGDADLLQLDPHRPAAERGEGGPGGAEDDGVHGGESAERPAQQPGERDRPGLLGGGGAGRGLRTVGDLAALVAQFGDPGAEEVQQVGDGHGSGGELEQRQELGHRLDHLGDGRGGDVGGGRVDERPGVEEGDPAAQHGRVVAVPGAQPPAGPGVAAVHLDEAGEPGAVPADPDLAVRQPQFRGGPFDVGGGQRARRGGSAAVAGSEVQLGPAGQPYGVGEGGAGPVRQVRRGGGARRRAGAVRVRRSVTALRAVATERGETSRSLESRANCSSGFRDVTEAVSPVTGRKPKRNQPFPQVSGWTNRDNPPAPPRPPQPLHIRGHMRGTRKRRSASS